MSPQKNATTIDHAKIKHNVQTYYGDTLQSSSDLQTSACTAEAMPDYLRPLLKNIAPEITKQFYGCGSPIPECINGRTVLDLGCGTGRDVYLLAQLAGEFGTIHGVDMTEAQLNIAKQHQASQQQVFGYQRQNTQFHLGDISDLAALGFADNSVDVVVSNCALNLSSKKEQVFAEIFRVLKPGGEFYFSDIFADRRIPKKLQDDPVLRGECLSGALYTEDFRRLLTRLNCPDYRVISSTPVTLNNPKIEKLIGMVNFTSKTIRAFKVQLEDLCENYGHVAYYKGSIEHYPHAYQLDNHHLFPKNFPVPVCGNTVKMLHDTRFAEHFRVIGDFATHHGPFDCALSPVTTLVKPNNATSTCC